MVISLYISYLDNYRNKLTTYFIFNALNISGNNSVGINLLRIRFLVEPFQLELWYYKYPFEINITKNESIKDDFLEE